ncbi:MAG: hypothetical protein NC209_04165 [Alistipes sp.]|nr:hypothetical protein [Lachnospiraceae bacterium]MCM1250325.1 hypothetical protein [Alistipes sp.]
MKKIMFNEAYGLTQATIKGRKTNTRRAEFDEAEQTRLNLYAEQGYRSFVEDNRVLVRDSEGTLLFSKPTRYKVGEVVAVAQSYERIYEELWEIDKYEASHYAAISEKPGWRNKMFVKAELMPYRIRITGMRAERLQEISDADCLREGIFFHEYTTNHEKRSHYGFDGFLNGGEVWFVRGWYDTPREAFSVLIDKVSGHGTWASNPWVVAYEYELVK